jgi:hypothetical protein
MPADGYTLVTRNPSLLTAFFILHTSTFILPLLPTLALFQFLNSRAQKAAGTSPVLMLPARSAAFE